MSTVETGSMHRSIRARLRQGLYRLTQLGAGRDQHCLECDHRCGAGLDRDVFGDLDLAIISTMPSLVFGALVELPASTQRAAFSASRVSLLPRNRRSRRSVRSGGGQSVAVGAGALYREGQTVGAEAGDPVEQLLVAASVVGERVGVEATTDVVQGEGDVSVFVKCRRR
ncbi:hypothetical protein ABZ949_32085 [Micromonospora tulbaghiae]|uniref:hypothetical protein n=1 Tax=Micromonospora tulbaghiae TaxID=479978 RepID=UPI0033FEB63D